MRDIAVIDPRLTKSPAPVEEVLSIVRSMKLNSVIGKFGKTISEISALEGRTRMFERSPSDVWN